PCAEDELRDVDDDRRALEVAGGPTPALQRPFDLAHAHAERHVELLERLRADDAVGGEAVPRLEALHGLDDRAAVDLRIDWRIRLEIAQAAQAVRERRPRLQRV